MNQIVLSPEQAAEIFKAIDGIKGILKVMPTPRREGATTMHGLMYGIISNLAVIQTNLASPPRVTPN